ncbi:MAG: tRNA pseudouridine(38-40) synthase TruA [Actinobacteria bacterium]|nr:tRNA pseudouridine(38-40) synthase TruA [Actinomycetota bacterium]MCG2820120.1 tRNA pseudouridine(38-40) synthase TruA [Actinomycetes bacterium]MBU4219474.1 tRNA pseudouridine(38-40) synthase TruA [Actinomycetota bacterium]MBU4359992.1 tRNA pseudouridine(38-40) synthase TruA [Actinomycetota bacterium]MBU4391205.1 tRNA pseudouridine(38-40) synthase TruA [Actinomycetota bacterium]
MTRYAARVEYQGTDFHGFQKQPGLPTIQGALESALATFAGNAVGVEGAGRTDAGVHAVGQSVAFEVPGGLDTGKATRGINALLPPGIAVTAMRPVREEFDPRRDAVCREYRYFILNRELPSPLLEDFTYHLARKVDRPMMERACALVPGERDFSAFKAKSEDGSCVRNVFGCELVDSTRDVVCLIIRAGSFLYRMVRIIGGAIVEVGRGRMSMEELSTHLEGGDGPCAVPLPAKGLFLWKVEYPAGCLEFDGGNAN